MRACGVCGYETKFTFSLKRHKASAHDIGVVWHACDHPGCEYKAKQASDLRRHKASAHDIGGVWHACDQPGCEYKAKQASDLRPVSYTHLRAHET